MNKKLIIVGLIILLLVDLGLVYQSYQKGKAPDYDLITVRYGEILEQVSATGTVAPASQIDLGFTSSGRVTVLPVKTGDRVTAGQLLISLDTSDLNFQAQSYQAALEIAQAKLAQLLAGSSAEDIALAETTVVNAQKSLDDAKKSLTDAETKADNDLKEDYEDIQRTLDTSLLTGSNSLTTNSDTLNATKLLGVLSVLDSQALVDAKNLKNLAEIDYNEAKSAVEQSKASSNQEEIDQAAQNLKKALNSAYTALGRTYDALQATITSPTLSQTDLDTYKSNISTARTNVNTAITNIVTDEQAIASQKITNQTNVNTAETSVNVAEGELNSAKDKLAIKKAPPREADIELYQAQVKQAQANLNQIKNQIAQKVFVAPIDGVITDVKMELGEMATANQAVVAMNSLADFEIKSDIAESEIAKIALGNSAKITFDAFGDEEIWSGKVVKIDPAQTVVQGVVYYKTTIGLSSADSRIKPGMTANLEIETARQNNVLIVPTRAVKESNGKKLVKILIGEEIKEIEVKTGLKNTEGEIEIVSGLKEGDEIVIEKKK